MTILIVHHQVRPKAKVSSRLQLFFFLLKVLSQLHSFYSNERHRHGHFRSSRICLAHSFTSVSSTCIAFVASRSRNARSVRLYHKLILPPDFFIIKNLRSAYASSKLAAVLILLYEKAGQIKVLLTTRSKLLRSHPGQTALPGGKCDESDRNVVETAVSASDSCAKFS